jgi:hypothetical protein
MLKTLIDTLLFVMVTWLAEMGISGSIEVCCYVGIRDQENGMSET